MRVLLDTSIVIWVMQDHPMPRGARQLIEKAPAVYVSAVVVWEIAIKVSIGKLRLDMDRLSSKLVEAGFQPLAITWEHSRLVRDLPYHHRDPFDRMLVAQAISEPLALLTRDEALRGYGDLVVVV
jgi:PIN domain nuclease of toxin-antitoxin system